jgi:hypothetical protein
MCGPFHESAQSRRPSQPSSRPAVSLRPEQGPGLLLTALLQPMKGFSLDGLVWAELDLRGLPRNFGVPDSLAVGPSAQQSRASVITRSKT